MKPENLPFHLDHHFDLREYEQEKLDVPGLIQPHGILIALERKGLTITHVSQNLNSFIDRSVESLIGNELSCIFSPHYLKKIKSHLKDENLGHTSPLIVKLKNGCLFRGSIHRVGKRII
ncbi:MAG: hypothetical protein HC796_02275 [Synechococcaceae cyanobacterium RL_1_2]|nr:hypothetical protein [Synechococcaceae cyanobacterium RL_1_2]